MHPVHVLFGTESGNAQGLAKRVGEALAAAGLTPKVIDMMDFDGKNLPALKRLLVVTSTYGNGDPPSNAEELHGYLMRKCPPLPELAFSVCGLGDTTYDRFAQCGKDFDTKLGELGAKRILARQDCDVDYDDPFDAWLEKVVPLLVDLSQSDGGSVTASEPTLPPPPSVDAPGTRRNPVIARVIANESLHRGNTDKETRHVALSLAGTGLSYELGDSIGVWPTNDPVLVDELLRATGADRTALVNAGGAPTRLDAALATKLDVVQPDARLVERAVGPLDSAKRHAGLAKHVIDLVSENALRLDANDLVSLLRPLAPRQYSIASSLRAHPEEVHLTVAIVRYDLGGKKRSGVASLQIADRAPVGSELPIYLHKSPSFRLTTPERPIVMIGPGTGVAPFRAFLEERRATGATGKSWLFFGSRHRASDFLYQGDFESLQASGTLTRLDLAFSRDQDHKIYVQHRMREHARDFYAYLEEGAVVYVCGDAHQMAPDVNAALVEIISREGSGECRSGARAPRGDGARGHLPERRLLSRATRRKQTRNSIDTAPRVF